MVNKGDKTRARILQAAKPLFIEKGYSAVSMSDLCAATGLSRGGLYRHFPSTDEVFSALLEEDRDDWEEGMQNAMDAGIPAARMLAYFFGQVKEDMAECAGRLSLATYEYERSGRDQHDFLVKRYGHAVDMMERLLRYGQGRGEFRAFDPRLEAEHLTIYLDGLKMAGAALSYSDEMVSRQLDYLLGRITEDGSGLG